MHFSIHTILGSSDLHGSAFAEKVRSLYCIVLLSRVQYRVSISSGLKAPKHPPLLRVDDLGAPSGARGQELIAKLILWTLAAIATVRVSFRSDMYTHLQPVAPRHCCVAHKYPLLLISTYCSEDFDRQVTR